MIKRFKSFILLLTINAVIFAGVDWILVKLDLLSPPFAYGLTGLGFGYPGVRKSSNFGAPRVDAGSARITIVMVGDSHSQLTFENPLDSHEFVLESALRAKGLPVEVISAGRGRYSPLQEYLFFASELRKTYRPQVLLLNFYSGNDFYDMLRPDDRPHFVREENNNIVIRDPVWISFVNPTERSWIERSRLLWGIDELTSRLGFTRVTTRIRMLSAAASQPGLRFADTVRYLATLRKSQEPRLGYPAAFAAQILNQALFFQHFPGSTEESIAFMRSLLQRARAENPDALLVLSSIPSAALMGAVPRDIHSMWQDTLKRTNLTEGWVARLEDTLVDQLEASSTASGWLFVDLRDCLRRPSTEGELYSSYDLHISAVASKLIGRCQAETLLANDKFNGLTHGQLLPKRIVGTSEASRGFH